MLNYKECNIDDFNAAMKEKDRDVNEISNQHLYILYTKYKADAMACSTIRTDYARSLTTKSRKRAERYKNELIRREEE